MSLDQLTSGLSSFFYVTDRWGSLRRNESLMESPCEWPKYGSNELALYAFDSDRSAAFLTIMKNTGCRVVGDRGCKLFEKKFGVPLALPAEPGRPKPCCRSRHGCEAGVDHPVTSAHQIFSYCRDDLIFANGVVCASAAYNRLKTCSNEQ